MRLTISSLVAVFVVVTMVAPGAVAGAGGGAAPAQTAGECTFPLAVTDATGTEVTIEEEPESVVTLNPSAAQMLWEIGAEEKATGVTKHAMNLDGAGERTNISAAGETISPEIVADVGPDLVLAPSSTVVDEEVVEVLREAGLTVYMYPSAESIDEVRERTLLTGQLVGECAGAEETVEWMDREIGIVQDAVEDEPKPDALYVFFGFTAGEETFIHEILETAGANNVAGDMGIAEYQQPNAESVAVEDPDWIVLNTDSPDVPEGEGYGETTAVQENQTVTINTNYLNRPAPRIVYAVRQLTETFHPEAYEEAVAAADSEDSTSTSGESESESSEADGSESDDSESSTPESGESESSTSESGESGSSTSESGEAETDESEAGGGGSDSQTAESDDGTGPGFGVAVVLLVLVSVAMRAYLSNTGGP